MSLKIQALNKYFDKMSCICDEFVVAFNTMRNKLAMHVHNLNLIEILRQLKSTHFL